MNKKLNQWIIFILIALLSSPSNLYADSEQPDPSASVFRFQKQMAKRGNAESQFKLGLMYETGSGVKQSSVLATSWYKKAAEQKHQPSANRLTYLEVKKSGFKEKHAPWLKQLKTDARFHEGEALFLLGQMYSEGTAVEKNLPLSLKLLRKASAANIPGADTEMLKVEDKLTKIEAQKTQQRIAQKKSAAMIAAPIATTVVLPSTVKPKKAHKRRSSRLANKKKKKKTKSLTKKTAVPIKRTNPERQIKPKNKPKPKPVKTVQTKPVVSKKTTEAPDKSHPMDTICGGINRFRRGCR